MPTVTDSKKAAIKEMKQRLCQIFHQSHAVMSNHQVVTTKKLVLHFDLNKTIVPVDSATGETVEAALNVYLSGLAQGKDREGEWHSKHVLSVDPSEQDDVSFYKFQEKRLLPDINRDRHAFRCHLMSFTDKPQGSKFKPHLKELLDVLKWDLEYDETLHKELTVPGNESCRFFFVLPAFYKLLSYLVEENRDFTVIFRTYGSDSRSVISSMRQAISNGLPFCKNLSQLSDQIAEDVVLLRRNANDENMFNISTQDADDICVNSNEQMYEWLSEMTGINAIRDNVKDWLDRKFDSRFGKPLWIDRADDKRHHIFFDDNIRPGMFDSIVNIRCRDNADDNFHTVPRADEHAFLNHNIVPVTFTEAILDKQYFIHKLQLCEQNYDTQTQTDVS